MGKQRGSVLAATLVMSLLIGAGAAGMLALTGVWSSTTSGRADRAMMNKAAESGLQMARGWLRQNVMEGGLAAYTSEHSITNGTKSIEGAYVKVALVPSGGDYFIVAQAQMPTCRERIRISWRIDNITGAAAPSTVTLREWSEAILACASPF